MKYKSVLTTSGNKSEHYGLMDQNERFAEMTGCCFGSNNFYLFVTGGMKHVTPEIFALLPG